MRIATAYIPHALYALAVMSISIHLVSKRRSFQDEKSSLDARISILESIAQQMRSDKPAVVSAEETERLMKLARASATVKALDENPNATGANKSSGISWKEVIFGKRPASSGDADLSHWERKDLEKGGVIFTICLKDLVLDCHYFTVHQETQKS